MCLFDVDDCFFGFLCQFELVLRLPKLFNQREQDFGRLSGYWELLACLDEVDHRKHLRVVIGTRKVHWNFCLHPKSSIRVLCPKVCMLLQSPKRRKKLASGCFFWEGVGAMILTSAPQSTRNFLRRTLSKMVKMSRLDLRPVGAVALTPWHVRFFTILKGMTHFYTLEPNRL